MAPKTAKPETDNEMPAGTRLSVMAREGLSRRKFRTGLAKG